MALDFTFSLLDQAGGMKPKESVTFRECAPTYGPCKCYREKVRFKVSKCEVQGRLPCSSFNAGQWTS